MPRRAAKPNHRQIAARLREGRGEIEAAIRTRIGNDGAPTETADPAYAEGLRAAVPAALDYCIEAIEAGEGHRPRLPTALLSQARVAARNDISLETVLRRYFAGYTVLGDFLIGEVESAGLLSGPDLKRLLRALAGSFDRLLAAVSEEFGRESSTRPASTQQRRGEQMERLLAGELIDTSEFGYHFEGVHLGAIGKGRAAPEALRAVARDLDCRLLEVRRDEETVWAWLGSARPIDFLAELRNRSAVTIADGSAVALGHPARGLTGFRLTHRQAMAALPLAVNGDQRLVVYADVALLAAVMRDDLLSTSLSTMYLAPLQVGRDGGRSLRETIRAYLAAEGNVSSAASLLGVKRQTVTNRLRTIEERIGRHLGSCMAEIDTALRLEEAAGGQLGRSGQASRGILSKPDIPLLGERKG